ncbi:MAG TPA: tetratricopeptide repeat protein, partial [Anaerolineales bacterium]|nr:tetratricopeptide repeat protein [Anaerolineales bacterium]
MKGPVLNPMISGSGYNGNHNTPWCNQSEADKRSDIDSVVNDFIDSAEVRRRLKNPKLEVMVDGSVKCSPFATMPLTHRYFHLPGAARFVQVFATENGKREIVSNLSLDQTQISRGRSWYSELVLEGEQIVSLMLQPTIDESGTLTSSNLVVGYQPRLTRPTHLFVRNDAIKEECSDEVKLLILKIRELVAQQRYDEALDLALKATRIDPNYWRAKTTLGVLLVALEQLGEGDKIFAEVLRDFPNTNKALATALHARAWVAETRCKLRPEAKELQEISRSYEQALKLDPSIANTRASLFICYAKSG